MGKLADNVLTVREDCSSSDREVSEPPTHARLQYVSCAGVTAGAHVAELDSTAVVMNKSSVFADAGVPKYVRPSEFLPIQLSAFPVCVWLLVEGENFCRLNMEICSCGSWGIQNSLQFPEYVPGAEGWP